MRYDSDDRGATEEQTDAGTGLERRLDRALRGAPLPPTQRRRLRVLLDEHEEREMRRLRHANRLELVAIAVVVLLLVSVSIWRLDPFSSGDDSQLQAATAPPATEVSAAAPAASPTAQPVASDCAMTAFAEQPPVYMSGEPVFPNWYYGSGIWLSPAAINGVNPSLPLSPHAWFAAPMPVVTIRTSHDQPELELTAERLDGPAQPFVATAHPDAYSPDGLLREFMVTFPEAGCWELTARTGSDVLTLTLDVRPAAERPDIAQALEAHAQLPYAPPASCAVTAWSGPEDRAGRFQPYWWLDGTGISTRSLSGAFFAEEPTNLEWFVEEWGAITLTGRSLGQGDALQLSTDPSQRVTIDGSAWFTTLLFPTPGCWEVQAQVNGQSLHAVIWVYQAGCRPEPGLALPPSCREPQGS
jgi:hypothetical protein